jgi:hypothetical protein
VQQFVDRIYQQAFAVHFADHAGRHFTRTETFDLGFFAVLFYLCFYALERNLASASCTRKRALVGFCFSNVIFKAENYYGLEIISG